jgi:hypothetical protein
VLLAVMFLGIYIPTILSEESFLRSTFPEFEVYARRVPRLWWRLRAAKFDDGDGAVGRFSRERYLHHREYNSAMGAAAIYGVLILRMLLWR